MAGGEDTRAALGNLVKVSFYNVALDYWPSLGSAQHEDLIRTLCQFMLTLLVN